MVSRSTWLHLRIPFSYFLLPVFIFALGFSRNASLSPAIWSFVIIHFLLYPASNGYNSYFDKDEKSIGGLKNPPPVRKELYFTSLVLDALAITLGYITINLTFAVMAFIYGGVSKMYSHPAVRIKKYAIAGWLITGLFQGLFTFLMCYLSFTRSSLSAPVPPAILWAGLLTSVMLWGNYPMTQIYQHEEDALHGDRTLSRMLGIRGTFLFVQSLFAVAAAGFFIYFRHYFSATYAYLFLIFLSPVAGYFLFWFYKVWKDEKEADFENTMRLNLISATCLNAFFVYFYLSNQSVKFKMAYHALVL